jgi:hypothetical protein
MAEAQLGVLLQKCKTEAWWHSRPLPLIIPLQSLNPVGDREIKRLT